MIRFLLLSLLVTTQALAYVPTIESLFRHGSNADVSSNGVSFTLSLKKIIPGEVGKPAVATEEKVDDYFRIFLNKTSGDNLKVAQARYTDKTFSESSLTHKIYFSTFSPYTLKPSVEQMEKLKRN